MWVRVQWETRDVIIGALYHLPKPVCETGALLDYIESSINDITSCYTDTLVILASDFNTLSEHEIVA
jgi:hypothetical protein